MVYLINEILLLWQTPLVSLYEISGQEQLNNGFLVGSEQISQVFGFEQLEHSDKQANNEEINIILIIY